MLPCAKEERGKRREGEGERERERKEKEEEKKWFKFVTVGR